MSREQEIRAVKESVNTDKRTATFIASTYDKDRHGTVVNQKGWDLENFNRNGIIGYQHNVYGAGMCEKATPDDIIGKGYAYVKEEKLYVEVEFKPEGRSELADKVWQDVSDGYLNTVSVGFIAKGEGRYLNDETGKEKEFYGYVEKGHTYYFDGQELLEVSVVNIPSNPKALKKSFRDSTANSINFLLKHFDYKYNREQVFEMKVRDIIDLLEGVDTEKKSAMIEADKIERDQVLRQIEKL